MNCVGSRNIVGLAPVLVFAFSFSLIADDAKLADPDIAVIVQAYDLWQEFGEELWPGWTKIEMPLIFVKEANEFAIGFGSQPSGFSKTEQTINGQTVYVRSRVFGQNLAASFPAVDGIPCSVIGTPDALDVSPTRWTLTAVHEMFHVLQMQRGSMEKIKALKIVESDNDGSWQLNFPFPYKNVDVMRLFHLEGYSLFLAIEKSEKENEVRYNSGTAVDARNVLRTLLMLQTGSDRNYNYASFQEWNEGIARYTENRIAKLAADRSWDASDNLQSMDGFQSYESVWNNHYKRQVNLFKHAGRVTRSRGEFYNIGLAKGLVLDRISENWRESYFAPGVWLDDLIAKAVGASTTLSATAVDSVLPDFELEGMSGETIKMSENGNRLTLVYFWQPWCPPCLKTLPKLQELKLKFGGDLNIIGVVDRCKDTTPVKSVIEEFSLTFPILLDPTGNAARTSGIEGYPHLFVVDKDSVVKWQRFGMMSEEEFAKFSEFLEPLIANQK